jgi:putative oxidoreductase
LPEPPTEAPAPPFNEAAALFPAACYLTPRIPLYSFFDMQDIGKLVLRLTVSGLILFHGISKIIHGVSGIGTSLASHHLPSFIAYGAYIGEVVAPIFVILGIWSRIGALFVAFNMVMAISLAAWRLAPTLNRGGGWGMELEAFYLLTAVAVFFLGPGTLSFSRGKGKLG